jgi:hypothetical protein
MKGIQYWPKVTKIQKGIMQRMKANRIIETHSTGSVLFEAEHKQYIIEPSGEVMSGGLRQELQGPQPEEKLAQQWEEADLPKRESWLARIAHPVWYKTRHWLELPRGTQETLIKWYSLGTLPMVEEDDLFQYYRVPPTAF